MPTLLESFNPPSQKIKDHLEHELSSLRTGKASPALIEHLPVKAYGASMKLMELGSISAADAKTLVVEPWDKAVLKDIERALQEANIGCGIAVDKDVIRVTLPALTAETREAMKKQVHKEVEKAKVSLRGVRDDVRNAVQAQEKEKQISEDEKFRQLEQLDKEAKRWQEELEKAGEKKVRELEF
ncbi:ribosome recycling factor [Candidatus Uhrbacteria bacterium RIFCSPHIGHO2_12_FULL_54_23]|uniref:Ribosome recycling factor n=2 Tax=Candidatus Uhriibacteriota TaxID=1752732 RepID=A0A1F7UJ91_9BACT|nr:MAG: ribosome recycling factor [Candidatus Uhrbacteria bacterium RIFCSPHIGHO2_12_FULL_54_23]OGL83770.1 MAG: ribosome recycling factor [Candidatus Uhrbacteria bacterium RIFCSPLOWO2_01_FULL_55_36]